MIANNPRIPYPNDKIFPDYLDYCLRISRASRFNHAKTGSVSISTMTIDFITHVLVTSKWQTARDLITVLQDVAISFRPYVVPYDDVVMNVFKRVLKIVRDTCLRITGKPEVINLSDVLKGVHLSFEDNYLNVDRQEILPEVQDAINEMQTDLENSSGAIISNAKKLIREDDVVMTTGYSQTIVELFKEVNASVNFKVIIVQSCYNDRSREIAEQLTAENIPTLVVPFTHIKAMLQWTTKVIFSAKSLICNGSVRALSGTRTIAQLAKNRKVPVHVIGGLHKLFDHYPCSGRTLDEFRHGISCQANSQFDCNLVNFKGTFAFDYVPATLIDVIVTNNGRIGPHHLYAIAFEAYHPDDRFI